MPRHAGQIRVEYSGVMSQAFREYLAGSNVRVTAQKPLTLVSDNAEDVLNNIRSFVSDGNMGVSRIQFRPAR